MTNDNYYNHIARALPYLAGDGRDCWKHAAEQAGLSPFYFQRIFKKYTGISPRQYIASLTLSDVKARLASGESVLQAALAAGLSGGGRAHDLFIAFDGTTPGEFSRQGDGLIIDYGLAASPYGRVFIAATARGICLLHFADDATTALQSLQRRWSRARLRRDDSRAKALAAAIFADGESPLHVRGTNFQINVWRALLALPVGAIVSYQSLARLVAGDASYARACAGAVAANPVAVLIPCHRVLATDGRLAGYAWGADKKRALLAREFAVSGRGAA